MRIWTRIWTWITDDAGGESELSGPRNPEKEQEKLDGFTVQGGDRITLAASTSTTLTLPSGMATAKGLWMRSNGTVTLTFNAGDEDLVLTKPSGANYARMYIDAPLTQIDVTNASLTDAVSIDFRVWA